MKINVFVSYSHKDKSFLEDDSLLGFLKGLEHEDVEFWSDEAIVTGDKWDEEIEARINDTHIALVFVSQWFLDSPYCTKVEISEFLEQSRKKGLIIFPVILSACEWERHEWLKARQFLPGGKETIEEHYSEPGRQKALFHRIRQDLRKQIEIIRQSIGDQSSNTKVSIESAIGTGEILKSETPPSLEHGFPRNENSIPDLANFMRSLEEMVVLCQRPEGHWTNSVSVTSLAVVVLSDHASTSKASIVIRRGIDWILKMQDPSGAWGRYRYRTREEEVSGEMPFDPDWPHTVYAIWAQLRLGVVKLSCLRGIEWLCDRYLSERHNLSLTSQLDLMCLSEMISNSLHPEYQEYLKRYQFPTWQDIQREITSRDTFLQGELKSLYRYLQSSNISERTPNLRSLAGHIDNHCHPWAELDLEPLGNLNFQTTVIRLLLLMDYQEYIHKAREMAMKMRDLNLVYEVDKINVLDTVALCVGNTA